MSGAKPASNIEWVKWGEIDPLWSVSALPDKQRGGSDPWTDEDFYRSGERAWPRILARWRRYGVDVTSCLEIGCGAGRLTRQLIGTFTEMHALDVSESMLAYARAHVSDPQLSFHLGDGASLPLSDAAVTAVFSTYVFQHFDSLAHATTYFREIARVLAPGGTLMIQLPIYMWPTMPRAFEALHRLKKAVGQLRASVQRYLLRHGVGQPIFRGLPYPIAYFFQTLPAIGLADVELGTFGEDHGAFSTYLFARRAPPSNG